MSPSVPFQGVVAVHSRLLDLGMLERTGPRSSRAGIPPTVNLMMAMASRQGASAMKMFALVIVRKIMVPVNPMLTTMSCGMLSPKMMPWRSRAGRW